MKKKEKIDLVQIRMVKDRSLASETKIVTPESAVEVLGELLKDYDREAFAIINLQTDGRPINANISSLGTINEALVSPREVFKSAILSNAHSVILLHNHPSGHIKPSRADLMTTERLVESGNLLGIPVRDSIIVGGDNKRYYSMREEKEFTFNERKPYSMELPWSKEHIRENINESVNETVHYTTLNAIKDEIQAYKTSLNENGIVNRENMKYER